MTKYWKVIMEHRQAVQYSEKTQCCTSALSKDVWSIILDTCIIRMKPKVIPIVCFDKQISIFKLLMIKVSFKKKKLCLIHIYDLEMTGYDEQDVRR